jgi:hypothetical protein
VVEGGVACSCCVWFGWRGGGGAGGGLTHCFSLVTWMLHSVAPVRESERERERERELEFEGGSWSCQLHG